MKTEEDAFWMLAVLLENVLVNDCYTNNLSGCHVEQRVFKDLLTKKCPRYFFTSILCCLLHLTHHVFLEQLFVIARNSQVSSSLGGIRVWCVPRCHRVVPMSLLEEPAFRGENNNGTYYSSSSSRHVNSFFVIHGQLFLLDWWQSFLVQTTLRVWDVLFYEGAKVLFHVALGIFKVCLVFKVHL